VLKTLGVRCQSGSGGKKSADWKREIPQPTTHNLVNNAICIAAYTAALPQQSVPFTIAPLRATFLLALSNYYSYVSDGDHNRGIPS
jgi:hypothetical protein